MAGFAGFLSLSLRQKQAQIAAMTTLLPLPDLPGVEALPASKQPQRRRRVVFLAFTDVEIVDLCGPLDVFQHANNTLQLHGRDNEPGYETLVVALQAGRVKAAGGLEIIATLGCDDELGEIDTLIVPGSPWIERACAEPRLIDWIQKTAPGARRVVSVCTGAFLLADAGLLENRAVTTHWLYCDRLAAAHPTLRLDPDRIFVRDGNIYTSGGITTGIDLALSLVEEDLGREAPRFIAGLMVVFLRRPGGQNQFSIFLQAEAPTHPDIRELQAWIVANPAEDHAVERLATRINMSARNFARQFLAESGMTPAKFFEHACVEAARCKLEQTNGRLEAIAAEAGFGSAERMQRSFQRLLNVSPQDYRARFQSTTRPERGRRHEDFISHHRAQQP
jgi:transcriptional regulator GlxA family with amidase domain